MSTSTSSPNRSESLLVGAILAFFIILGISYSLAVPPFEVPDEPLHYTYARFMAENRGLPSLTGASIAAQETAQPPLYYFLLGRLLAILRQRNGGDLGPPNPSANLGNPILPGNKNFMLYSTRLLPLRGANLSIHIGRWFSLVLGSLSLWLVYLTARQAFPDVRWLSLYALMIMASIPQFAFISTSLSNDNMIILLSMAVVYWLVRLLARDKLLPIRWWELSILGMLLGLAALSKLQGLALIPFACAVIVWLACLRRDWKLLPRSLALVAVPAVLVAGWWFWRNHNLYGDWLGVRTLAAVNAPRTSPWNWSGFLAEMRGVRYSFWSLFGWFNIVMPDWIYKVLDGVSLLAFVGLLLMQLPPYRRQALASCPAPVPRLRLLLVAWAGIMCVLIVYWSATAMGGQGRLLYPAASALIVLLVMGLSFWLGLLPPVLRRYVLALLPIGLLCCSVYVLMVLLPAAYRAPQPVATVPIEAIPVKLRFGDQIELLAVTTPAGRFGRGDSVPITLYLRTQRKLAVDLALFVQLLDERGHAVGNVTTHPGWGRNPTSLWQPGAIYPDHYLVSVDGDAATLSPLLARVYVGFIDPETKELVSAYTAEGAPYSDVTVIGSVVISPSRPLKAPELKLKVTDAVFGNTIQLAGYDYSDRVPLTQTTPLTVTLLWEATGTPATDYTAFVHLVDLNGKYITGFDQPPAENRFPTHYWKPGDSSISVLTPRVPADLAPGTYQLWAGLYDTQSKGQARLPISAANLSVQNRSVLLGTIEFYTVP